MDSLKKKAVKGGVWSTIDNVSQKGIMFVIGVILANILSPSDYGQVAIITIFTAIFASVADSGFSSALIRKSDATDKDYNTTFIFNFVVSVSLSVLLYFLAPLISLFFNQDELTPLIRVMSLSLILGAIPTIHRVILTKNIDFKTQTKISVIASLSSGGLGIAMAYMGYGVWSLVIQQLTRQAIVAIMFWVSIKWAPKLEFSKDSFKELFAFGSKLLVSGLIDTLWKNAYQFVIGKFYTPATLGQYGRALSFSTLFSSNLTAIVQRVSYPVLSSIQDDKTKLKGGYKRIIKFSMYVSFVCMIALAAIAEPLILTLIGEKWLPAVGYLQIICFSAMLYPLHAINLNMLQVQGRSDLFLKLEIIKKLFGAIPLCLGIFVGIYWMLAGSIVTSCISYYINAYHSGKLINYSIVEQLKDITPSFLVAIATGALVYMISFLDLNSLVLLIVQLIACGAITIALSAIFKLEPFEEIKGIVVPLLKRKK